jgi:O-antigen ligase
MGWLLWPALASLPWLIPFHGAPWATFYSESAMALALLPIAAWAAWISRGRWRVDVVVAGLTATALVPLIQAAAGQFAFPSEALLVALYLSSVGLAVLVGRASQEARPGRLADALFASLLVAALLSTGMAVVQWLGIDVFDPFVAPPMRGGRPVANVGQANNLSTLLVWGIVSTWWAFMRQRLGAAIAIGAAALLLLGVALTQSRTGYVAVVLIAAAAVLGRHRFRSGPTIPAIAALAVLFAIFVAALEPASQLVALTEVPSMDARLAPGKRPLIWKLAVEEISRSPWIGYGWNQASRAHVPLAEKYAALEVTVQHAHNVVLDLLVWNGMPLGLLLTLALVAWAWHQVRRVSTPAQLVLLVAVAVFGLHAMLELPHVYLFFLLPVGAMVGTLNAMRPIPGLLSVSRPLVGALVFLHACLLMLIVHDYLEIEADTLVRRMRAAHIAERTPAPAPKIYVLVGLQEALVSLGKQAHRGMTSAELDRMRLTLDRYPSYWGLFGYAKAAALNGRAADAAWAMDLLCHLHTASDCESAIKRWDEAAADGAPELASARIRRR